jgi:cation transport ATPase
VAAVDTVALDKTGTLTGRLRVEKSASRQGARQSLNWLFPEAFIARQAITRFGKQPGITPV